MHIWISSVHLANDSDFASIATFFNLMSQGQLDTAAKYVVV